MVCAGCTFTVCMGMDCPELVNTAAVIQTATKLLHASNNLNLTKGEKTQ